MISFLSASTFAQERSTTVEIGTAEESTFRLPCTPGNWYSISEQIYTADEISAAGGGPGTITSISFYGYNSWTTTAGTRTWDVYLVNTTKNTFSSASDWVGVNASQKVFSGTISIIKNTWTTVPISNFTYEGGNLLVVVDDNSGSSTQSSGHGGYVFNTASHQSNWAASSDDINPSNPNMTCTAWETKKNNIRFEFDLTPVSCPTPQNLVVSAVSSNSATLTWQAGGDETAWNVQYKTASSGSWSPSISVSSPTYTITNLTTNTDYQARVQAACSGEESGWKTVSFATECEAIDLPYYYNFSDASVSSTGSMPDCWLRFNDATNSSYQGYPRVNADYHHNTSSPTRSLLFNYSSNIPNQIAILPVINVNNYSLDQYQVVFWVRSASNKKLQVGTMTDPNNANTFRQIGEITTSGSNTSWQEYTVRLDNNTYTEQEKYIAIKSPTTNATSAIYLDDIDVQLIPSCDKPYSLTKSDEYAHGATIAWVGGNDNWQIAYSTTSNFDPDDLNQCSYMDVQSNPYTFTTLDPNTKYYIRIRTKCGEDDYSYWSTTPTNFYIQTTIACPAPTGLTANNVTALSADISWTDSNASEWELAYSTTSTFTESTTTTIYPNTTFYILDLSPDTRYYVKVRANCSATNDGYSNWTSYINFKTPERCITPTNLHCASFTNNTASLEWTIGDASQNDFTIAYSTTSGFDPETAQQKASSTNRVILTRLTPETTYYAKVRANCSGDDGSSNWSDQCSFRPSAYGELVVNDGTTNNSYIPVYGLYTDEYSASQFIIPSGQLSSITGTNISKLTFYSSNTAIDWGAAEFKVFLKELDNSTLPSLYTWEDMTEVYEGSLSIVNSQMSIEFDQPYKYNGHNLLVGVRQVTIGTYKGCSWFGVNSSNMSIGGYYSKNDNSTYNKKSTNFSPKVAITYTTPTAPVFTKAITGYQNGAGRYYLIASPIDDVDPNDVEGMIADPAENYDLYYFQQNGIDQVEGESVLLEWRNYKKGSFNLVSGKGYLYANKNDIKLNFTGTPIDGPSFETSLIKDYDVRFPGWNLVGNPFAEHTAYIDRPFYVMNENGTEILAQSVNRGIEPMEGVFVIATENGQSLTFSITEPTKTSKALTLNLNNGQSIIDRAIVSFGEGQELPKFQLNANSTKVYISKDSQDYAVVCCDNMGEMPVSFKAAQNGTYSININTEGTEMAYLHLIDNMTGADIDMLQSTSYSFEAKPTDYASRFKLVFVSGNADDDNENFAFYNNGNWVIANNSEATLQVIDLNGRILCSQQIEGCTETRIDAAAGIYMIRLVSGNDVKVQKIVIK